MNARVRRLVEEIYGGEKAGSTYDRIEGMIATRFSWLESPTARRDASNRLPLDEHDAFLITYGDQFREEGAAPLATLTAFASRFLSDSLSGIHILPFFPYTSDDGFSISDYSTVNPELGSWTEVEGLSKSFRLMSDLVLNHCSVSHRWFKGFLDDDPTYRDYFITVPEGSDLSMVARPRALPLLTEFETKAGRKKVWTTFSADQVDLNYANPDVLIEMIGIFFEHIRHGVQVVRLDAIAYLWKEIGHSCLHHPKTHAVVKLFRALAEELAPWVVIITET
ncbi:MAG TPA: alpha-amylase family glycosyl hydrolase, partial [Spirochaetia bacterium]|nr:alpha-amylase family glycosyl hydrolase [Spirochaetia bacterium]